MPKYKLERKHLDLIDRNQLNKFLDDFTAKIHKSYVEINFEPKNLILNNTWPDAMDNNIHSIGLFSGAGGLDIGAQLAGSKVISSLDFDSDSVSTMKSNDLFNHACHFHKDIRDLKVKEYSLKLLNKK